MSNNYLSENWQPQTATTSTYSGYAYKLRFSSNINQLWLWIKCQQRSYIVWTSSIFFTFRSCNYSQIGIILIFVKGSNSILSMKNVWKSLLSLWKYDVPFLTITSSIINFGFILIQGSLKIYTKQKVSQSKKIIYKIQCA